MRYWDCWKNEPVRKFRFRLTIALTLLFSISVLDHNLRGDELRKVQREYLDKVLPVLKRACFDCHAGDDADAGFNLEGFETIDQILKARKKWKKVELRVAAREMPPDDCEPLSDSEHKLVLDWVDKMLNSVDCSNTNPGRITIRRLNRVEYRNTVRDLLGVDYDKADQFPGDDVGYGFDNIADVLSLPPILMEKYLDAAEDIVNQAIVDPSTPAWSKSLSGNDFRSTGGSRADGFAHHMSTNGTITSHIDVPQKGTYQIKVVAFGTPSDRAWPRMEIHVDGKKVAARTVESSSDKPGRFEFETRLKKGKRKLGVKFTNDHYVPNVSDRNLSLVGLSVSGPIGALTESHKRLIPESPQDRSAQSAAATKTLNRFASLAYRRRVYRDELNRLMQLYEQGREQGDNHEVALRYCFQAVLVSPFFLFKVEVPTRAGSVRTLSDFELATSLSYFLWSSMPDADLFRLAASKKLQDPDAYLAQIKRMMKDPKAEALVDNFVAQWLQLGHLEHIKPDPDLFPNVDEAMLKDMARETKLLVTDLIRRDGSLLELLDSEFTFINQRLAKHYGLPNVRGETFRRVSLGKSRRGGLLTHASILTLTSNPNRTSPVKRGKWIMENLLGEEPPPPDPDAMALEEQKELTGTLRQRLVQHRADPNCAVCHLVMDELGFALENFDAVGKWRDKEESNTIDARGELPDGTKFEGAIELQKMLKTSMKEQFIRCLTEKMLIYALGRGLEYFDECAVDKIIQELERNDYRFSTLIRAVATSDPFLKRKGPQEVSK